MTLQTRFPSLSPVTAISATLALMLAGGCKIVQLEPGEDDDTGDAGTTTAPTPEETEGEPVDPTAGPAAHCAETELATLDILATNCEKCHGGSSPMPQGSINYITDLEQLIREGKVKPGNPEGSRIYARMLEEASPMPPLSEAQQPSDDDVATVGRWIAECAGLSACGDQEFITAEKMLRTIQNDINGVAIETQPFVRYFHFVHLYNTGWCSDQIDIYRMALIKLVNSLSQDTQITLPVPIDENKLIYRVDIRDYKWNEGVFNFQKRDPVTNEVILEIPNVDLWDLMALSNPYTVNYFEDEFQLIAQQVGSQVFLQQGDAFLDVASQPPLYHDVVGIPATRQELEEEFGIFVDTNIDNERFGLEVGLVDRAGFRKSDVSFNHRMIERHEFPDASNRVYWLSYDFRGEDNLQNFFALPFDFEEDGGEIIFNLPNGLQAYMLVDAMGNRLDTAPADVVKDKNQEDGIVINGVSCMGCHNKGMITVQDDLRYELDQGGSVGIFNADQIKEIENVFPTREEFTELLNEDTNRFTDAAIKTGVNVDSEQEPILTVFLAFDQDVKIRRAAAELGLTENNLLQLLSKLGNADLDKLRNPGTPLSRDTFTTNFARTICDLNLGVTLECLEKLPSGTSFP